MKKNILKIAFFVALAVAAMGSITMLLWNWLVPALFNGPVIGIWEAFGILLLSKLLFGGWKKGWHHHHCGTHSHWKHKMKERWEGMSDEEKEKLKEKYSCCGWNHHKSADTNKAA